MWSLCKNCLKNNRRIISCSQRWFFLKESMSTVEVQEAERKNRPSIKIPKKKKRDALTVLKALQSTVGPDCTRHNMQMMPDDPYISTVTANPVYCNVAYLSGKEAAKNIATKYPELVEKSMIHDPPCPNIEDYFPKKDPTIITDVNEDALKERIKLRSVKPAYQLYKEMTDKGIEISQPTLDMLLELLCYYGDHGEKTATPRLEYFNIRLSREESFSITRALKVYGQMNEKSPEAYNSMLRATLDPREISTENMKKFKEIYKEMFEKKIGFERCTYHSLLKRTRLLSEIRTDPPSKIICALLEEMKKKGYMPTLETFNAVLEGINKSMISKESKSLTQRILAEMKVLKIEPSLTTWVFVIANCLQVFIADLKYGEYSGREGFNRGYCASLLYSVFDHLEGKQYAVTNDWDFLFLPFAMRSANTVQDVQLAHRIEDFHRNGKNQLLLSQSQYKRSDYYLDYFGLLKREEGLDCFMIAYRKTVPALYFPRQEMDIRNIISVEEVELEDKFEYLAEILEGTMMRIREAYLPVFAKKAYKPEVQTKFAKFVKEIKDSKVEREKEKEIFGKSYREDLTKRDLSDMMKVNIFAGNFEEAWDCFQLSKDKMRSSSLEQKSIKLLLNKCIELNDVEKVIEVLNNIADEEMWILDHCKQLVLDTVELSRDQRESITCL